MNTHNTQYLGSAASIWLYMRDHMSLHLFVNPFFNAFQTKMQISVHFSPELFSMHII